MTNDQLELCSKRQCFNAGQELGAEKAWAEVSCELGYGDGDREKCLREINRVRYHVKHQEEAILELTREKADQEAENDRLRDGPEGEAAYYRERWEEANRRSEINLARVAELEAECQRLRDSQSGDGPRHGLFSRHKLFRRHWELWREGRKLGDIFKGSEASLYSVWFLGTVNKEFSSIDACEHWLLACDREQWPHLYDSEQAIAGPEFFTGRKYTEDDLVEEVAGE